MRLKPILSKAIDNPDITLAIFGCIASIPLILYLQTVIHQPVYTTVGIIVFLACLAYLLIRRKSLPSLRFQVEAKPHIHLISNILFFCLLAYSVVIIYQRPELYTRPLGYFITMAAMAAIVAIEILFLPPRKAATYFTLFKIILIGLSLAWSQLLIFPSIVGQDPWYHQKFTLTMLDAGYIPAGYAYSAYSKLPCMHLVIGATSLLTGLNYKLSTMLSVGSLQVVCDVLFIFLLGKFIHSAKAGLLAALLLGVANWHIRFAYQITPNTIGVVFIPIIIYLLFKIRQKNPMAAICLSVLFMVTLIWTHTIAALGLAMLLFLIWLGFEVYKRLRYKVTAAARVFLVTLILFTGATLSHWTLVSGHIQNLTRLVQIGFSEEYYGALPPWEVSPEVTLPAVQSAIAQYRDSVPDSERLFNQLGFFLFFAFAFIGSFAILSKGIRNRFGFALVIAGLVILAINFFGIVFYRRFLPARWNYLLQILLAVPVGIAFFWLGDLPRREIAKAALVGTMTFILAFLMIMSPQINLDNRTFSPNIGVRYALTDSEMQAIYMASSISTSEVGGDWYITKPQYAGWLLDRETEDISEELCTRDFTDCQDSFLLIRGEITEHPFKVPNGIYQLDYDLEQALNKQGFLKIYACSSVSGFIGESR